MTLFLLVKVDNSHIPFHGTHYIYFWNLQINTLDTESGLSNYIMDWDSNVEVYVSEHSHMLLTKYVWSGCIFFCTLGCIDYLVLNLQKKSVM